MEDLIKRITIDPNICNGKPIIRGMRITVSTILEYLAAGQTVENILKAYPILEYNDIKASLESTEIFVIDKMQTTDYLSTDKHY